MREREEKKKEKKKVIEAREAARMLQQYRHHHHHYRERQWTPIQQCRRVRDQTYRREIVVSDRGLPLVGDRGVQR